MDNRTMPTKYALKFLSVIGLSMGLSVPIWAASQETAKPETISGYDKPPSNILSVMEAPSLPSPSVNPTHDAILLVSLQTYPSIERVARPYLRLAGVRIETGNHSKHDTPGGYGVTRCVNRLELVHIPDAVHVPVMLPPGACPAAPLWSADGKHFAFENIATEAVELWIGDIESGAIRKVQGVRLNPMLGDTIRWMPDQQTLLIKEVPAAMGAPPSATAAPIGPGIQESDGTGGQSSTYETRDTLGNRHDEDLFDYYGSSQLALVTVSTGVVQPIGKAANFLEVVPAPDGKHLLVSVLHKPYSYVTTYERFPQDFNVWLLGKNGLDKVQPIASRPLSESVPVRGEPLGPRDFDWRATDPATLIWAEALDGGDWKVSVPARDKVMMLKAPFTAAPVEVTRTEQRFSGIDWSAKPELALMYESDANRNWMRTFIVNFDAPKATPKLLWDLSLDEHYANPGAPVHRMLANGQLVFRTEGDSIFLAGSGASPDGDRPFLDRLDLTTLKSERLFRSGRDDFEQFLAFIGADTSTFLTWHQSPMDPPNAFVRTLGASVDAASGEASRASTSTALTHIADPTPIVRQIKKRLVHYKRADGLDLSFTLYTPPGYQEGTRVPTILYAYPTDFAGAAQAAQVTGSQETFTRLAEYRLLLLAGYAILDNASFPVVGDPKKAYDTYLDQLVADAQAAVDEGVRLGVADPDRIGVTGHSHGALMTANLIAHTRLFRAGVATSGSYNKTMTAFGFQNERRSLWEAPDVYRAVSPLFSADKIKDPLLIIHGAEDANPGTTPIQSTLLYEAVRGNGGTTRLVMLPHEPHWYTAMESQEQLLYEMVRWFDKYVKNAAPRAPGGQK
jgi:dipeptidyl aminopeptidase/acylaminoacyl peptidase